MESLICLLPSFHRFTETRRGWPRELAGVQSGLSIPSPLFPWWTWNLERRASDLVWLESCELVDGFPGIRSDYHLLYKASYMIEMTETLFPLNVPSPEMFQLLRFSLGALSEKRDTEALLIAFQARAMKIGGFSINLSKCSLCGRLYRGKGRALFNPPGGTIVCLGCETESRLTPGMEPKTVSILGQLQSSDLSLSDVIRSDEDIVNELKVVLRVHSEHCFGKRLKSSKYLDS